MLTTLGFAVMALGAWIALLYCAYEAARDLAKRLDARALEGQDGFTPSMARWGYVSEKRGAR